MSTNLEHILYETPHSLARLGEATFLKRPLFATSSAYEPIYISRELFREIFKQNLSWEQCAQVIKQLFSISLDKEQSNGKQCGWAFVDRQKDDPYSISLRGNQGSGRAYYTGPYFNMKGEKTPLVASTNPTISNGQLSMSDGIWSAFIANSLYKELNGKLAPVLAILRINKKQSLIVRIDENGALDRLTHLFFKPKALTQQQLEQVAYQLGQLEAKKFIRRILHGAWSSGNTSLAGHLIDYDSICAVKGRQPQCSYTNKYLANFFGFEHLGQRINLKFLSDNTAINSENVAVSQLEAMFQQTYHQFLQAEFIELMGFNNIKKRSEPFRPLIKSLVLDFCELAPLMRYVSWESCHADYPSSLFSHLFDFSCFFRVYPLLKLTKQFTPDLALKFLVDSPRQKQRLLTEYQESNAPLPQAVEWALKDYLIPFAQEDLEGFQAKALNFIEQYDTLFDQLQQTSKLSLLRLAARAYVINEDRLYLLSFLSPDALLVELQDNYPPKIIDRLIQNVINASERFITEESGYTADNRVWIEGYSHLLLNQQGEYQAITYLYDDFIDWTINQEDNWHVMVGNQTIAATCQADESGLCIRSQHLPFDQLIANCVRENSFLVHPFELYRNNIKVRLTDLFLSPLEQKTYFS